MRLLDSPLLDMDSRSNSSGSGGDRLSQLPESATHHILSFLTTKEVVRASLVAKKYSRMWASMTKLNFDEEQFANPDSFQRFVNTVLMLRDASTVEKFRLRCRSYDDVHHIDVWARYAVKHKVRVVELNLSDEGGYVPDCIFTCQSLKELILILNADTDLNPPKVTCNLRRLYLDNCRDYDGFVERVVSVSPSLQELYLESCALTDLDISSSSLKILDIGLCWIDGARGRVSAPSLRSLTYVENRICPEEGDEPLLENLSSLIVASVNASYARVVDLIKGLSCANTIDFFMVNNTCILGEELSEFPTFDNLKRLKVGGYYMSGNIPLVVSFLQNAPNIEKLTILNKEPIEDESRIGRMKVSLEPRDLSFTCRNLHSVEVQGLLTKDLVDRLKKLFS